MDIEQILQKLADDWPATASIADPVMQRIVDAQPAPTSRAEGLTPSDERAAKLRRLRRVLHDSAPNAPTVPGDEPQGSGAGILLPSPLAGEGSGVRGQSANRSRRIGALAAATVVLASIAAWFYFAGQPNSLSAQVIRAMDRAKSLEVVTFAREFGPQGEDRGLKKAGQSWFVADVGFRYDWDNEIRLGNNTSFWRYNRRTKTAFRSASGGIRKLLDDWFDVHKFAANLQSDYVREPASDTSVRNERLKAYRLVPKPNLADRGLKEGKSRMLVFLDSHSRIGRVEFQKEQKGAWQSISVQEWSYDVPIDAKVFEPKFGDGVKVVESDNAFDELTSLDKAVYVEDRAGLIYAVHHIERFEGGGLLVMSSVRGDEETLKQFPPQRRMFQFGLYYVDGPGTNYDASSQIPQGCFRIVLARASHNGIDLQWWIQLPRMQPPNYFDLPPDAAWIMAGMTANPLSQFGQAYAKAHGGVLAQEMWKLPLGVSNPPKLPTLAEIATSVYADAAALGAIPEYFLTLDLGIENSNGQPTSHRGSPEDTTPTQFAEAVERHVRWWFRQDVEFQFKFATDPAARGNETVAVSYNPYVTAADTARLRTLPALKRLYLNGTPITDADLAAISGLSQLKELALSDTEITDAGLGKLKGLHALKVLFLKNTRVTKAEIERLKAAIPKLKVRK